MKNKISKQEKIEIVLKEKIKNIEPTLYNKLYNILLEYDTTNQKEMQAFVYSYLKLKSYNIHSYNYWINRGWSTKEIDNLRPILKNDKSPMTIEFWINKINPDTNLNYTKEEAEFKIKSQRKLNKEFWINKGYTTEEAILKVKEYQTEQSNKYCIKQKQNPHLYNSRTTTHLKYWIKNGYSEEDAKQKLKERQTTFSKELCIKKYGDVEGLIKYKARCKELGSYNTLHYYIQKYGEVEGLIKYKNKTPIHRFYKTSKEAYYFFIPIYKYLRNNNFDIKDILWGVGKTYEYFIYDKDTKRVYFYDFVIPKLKLIIEYHGIKFHPNPKWEKENKQKWENWKSLYNNFNANEKRKYDIYKNNVAVNNGFKIIEIFSDDIIDIENKQNIINNIINIINTNINEKN